MKKVSLKISQYSQENTCFGIFFNKVAGPQACNFIKKKIQQSFFPVIIAKFLKPFSVEHLPTNTCNLWQLLMLS